MWASVVFWLVLFGELFVCWVVDGCRFGVLFRGPAGQGWARRLVCMSVWVVIVCRGVVGRVVFRSIVLGDCESLVLRDKGVFVGFCVFCGLWAGVVVLGGYGFFFSLVRNSGV